MLEFLSACVAFYLIAGFLSFFVTSWYYDQDEGSFLDLVDLLVNWHYYLFMVVRFEWDSYRTWPETYRLGGVYKEKDEYTLTFEYSQAKEKPMRVDERDHLILRDEKDRKFLAKTVDTDPLRAVICDKNQKDRDKAVYVDFELKDVVANLGKKPAYGDAYRVPVEYVRQSITLEPWGTILFYKELSEDQFKKIVRSIKKVAATLEEYRIFPHEKPINLQIKDLKGLEGGHYKHFFNDKKDDELIIRATEFQDVDYYLYHEVAHGVWFMLCDDGVKAKWIKAYYLNKKLIEDTDKKIKQMRQELIDVGNIKDYRKQLDEDDVKELFSAVIKQFKDKYAIDHYDINSLIADGDDLTEIWPAKAPEITKDAGVLVSEYANKNPKELFAECFAYYFDDTKNLPKSMEKLMTATITAVRYQRNSVGKKMDLE